MSRVWNVLAGVSCLLFAASAPAALSDLINPGFEQNLAVGWTLGGDAFRLDDGSGDHVAAFGEQTAAARSFVSQDILIGLSDTVLTFDYTIDFSGSFAGGSLRDGFSARILNPLTLEPLLYTPGRSDYFFHQIPDPLITPEAILFDNNFVARDPLAPTPFRAGWYQVSADISALQGQTVRLEFGLLRGDNGQSTFAAVDNIVPEPSVASLALMAGGALLVRRKKR